MFDLAIFTILNKTSNKYVAKINSKKFLEVKNKLVMKKFLIKISLLQNKDNTNQKILIVLIEEKNLIFEDIISDNI